MSRSLPHPRKRFFPFLLVIFALAACAAPATPGAMVAQVTATAPPTATSTATATATQTATVSSNTLHTPTPTATRLREGSTATATRTRRPTATRTPAPTPSPSATSTPAPTALPSQLELNGATMLLVPADFFVMGVAAEVLVEECALFQRSCDFELMASAAPQHPVHLDSFYIDAYEVSNERYAAFLTDKRQHETGCLDQPCILLENSRVRQERPGVYGAVDGFARHPVHSVTWYGATAYCQWRGARLPTEAEWEKAASWDAATNSKYLYPWGNHFDGAVVNFCDITCTQAQSNGFYDDGFAETAPVGSFPGGRSPVGAYDMGGNVWEWVSDWFSPLYYTQSPQYQPGGPATGVGKGLRGGSWFDTGNFATTVFRTGLPPAESNDSIGFRCAVSPNE